MDNDTDTDEDAGDVGDIHPHPEVLDEYIQDDICALDVDSYYRLFKGALKAIEAKHTEEENTAEGDE